MTGSRSGLIRWLKFNAVGLMGICVQLAILALLRSGLGWNYLLSTALAVEITVIHNFLWHERFTWADRLRILGGEELLPSTLVTVRFRCSEISGP